MTGIMLRRRIIRISKPSCLSAWAAVTSDAVTAPRAGTTSAIIRNFHASYHALHPVRRRRRGESQHSEGPPPSERITNITEDSVNEGPQRSCVATQHPPVLDTMHFRHAASELLDKLERALEPMKAKNDFFLVERLDGEIGEVFKLDLGPKEGFYQLEFSEDECIFQYSSPISGQLLYCLSSVSGEWVGCDDGHSFEGIFVRDLIRQCQGLPDL
jgi:hypothetical protein